MSDYSQLPQPLLKVIQVAKTLNICVSQAYRLVQIGEIPSVRISGSVRVLHEDLARYIQEHRSKYKRIGIQ